MDTNNTAAPERQAHAGRVTELTIKACTMSRKELEAAIDDLWNRVSVIQRLAYLLNGELEHKLDESRGKVEGDLVTLHFQKRGIDVTGWLAGETWSKIADLQKLLDDLVSDARVPAGKAVAA